MKEQTKLKISYSLRNRKKSATHIHRIAESLRGKKKTEEHKKAISKAMKEHWRKQREGTIYRGDKTCIFTHLIIK